MVSKKRRKLILETERGILYNKNSKEVPVHQVRVGQEGVLNGDGSQEGIRFDDRACVPGAAGTLKCGGAPVWRAAYGVD